MGYQWLPDRVPLGVCAGEAVLQLVIGSFLGYLPIYQGISDGLVIDYEMLPLWYTGSLLAGHAGF